MTIDTHEYNDPVQIINDLEHDKDNKRKKFFEKGLAALLTDPHFILLYVPKGDRIKMQIIRPACDPYHRKRMVQRINEAKRIPSFYYALSHLWGLSENNQHLWHEIGDYVDDENGQPVKPVSMRPEKRDTLLALLKDHRDSYWWIDVLCAPADTPLDIMGDIYACCLECVAMIDCHPRVIPSLHAMMGAGNEFPGLFGSRDPVLEDLLPYKQLYDKKYPKLMGHLFTLLECQWWNRVWTWQEMVLPVGDVRLVAETATHFSQNNTIEVDKLFFSFYSVGFVLQYYVECLTAPDASDISVSEVATVTRCLMNIYETRNHDRVEKRGIFRLIRSLKDSSRCCMDPVDYVYGALGIFQMKIPRMDDPDDIWRLFLCELDKHVKNSPQSHIAKVEISERAHRVDLRKAKNMADVYKDLIQVTIRTKRNKE